MDDKQKKLVGIGCFVVCAICLFVAVERYNANSNAVQAINSMSQSTPLGGLMGGGELQAAMPAATKYSLFFGVIAGIGGAVLLTQSRSDDSKPTQ
jgi:hypothetical protein